MLHRLLVVGLGSIGHRHVRIVRELVPGVRIVALRHRDQPGPNVAGVDSSVTSLSDALKGAPQAAVIANPTSHHLKVALPLAEAGIHLLVEKPIASQSQGVSQLIDLCRLKGVALMTGYNLRFTHTLQRFRELLKEGRIGRVLSVRAEVGQFLPSWRTGSDYRHSVSAKTSLGGGVLLELSHEIDYLRWIFGEVAWVSAVLRRQSSLEIDVEDTAHLMLGCVPDSGSAPVLAALSMDCVRHDTTRICTAIGERGSLRWNGVSGTVEMFEAGGKEWQTLFVEEGGRDTSYRAEWKHFMDCIEKGASPGVSGHDGLAVLRVIEAARESSASGCLVQIQETA